MNRRFGWLPDVPDQRDLLFAKRVISIPRLPASVDLRPTCSPVEDQGNLGSCVGNAVAGALEFLELKDKVKYWDASRLFLYYNARVLEGTARVDSGCMIRDAVKSAKILGACTETLWPYDILKFAKRPPAACYADGLKRQVLEYQRLLTLDECRTCLALGYPFVFGFSVYESFESYAVATTGIAPMPKKSERLLGGHAVLACGYDMKTKRLLVKNSWGTGWGIKGYFWLPFGFITDRNLSDDYWRIVRGEQA